MGIRNWIRVLGGMIIMAGITCIPMGPGGHPYRFTLPFEYFVETGAFLWPAVILICAGVLIILLSFVGGFE